MPEALNAKHRRSVCASLLGEELLRAETVADGADADANGVHRHVEERVEGHDLVDLASPDVHVVRDRVRQLGGNRADLAPDAPEIVEEPGARPRELRQELGEPQNIDAADDSCPKNAPRGCPNAFRVSE